MAEVTRTEKIWVIQMANGKYIESVGNYFIYPCDSPLDACNFYGKDCEMLQKKFMADSDKIIKYERTITMKVVEPK